MSRIIEGWMAANPWVRLAAYAAAAGLALGLLLVLV